MKSEDFNNAMQAVSLKKYCNGKARLLIIQCLPASKVTVSNLGIREHECISLTEVKCEFFGISCRVPGAMSMI